jgi:hypothetical protein
MPPGPLKCDVILEYSGHPGQRPEAVHGGKRSQLETNKPKDSISPEVHAGLGRSSKRNSERAKCVLLNLSSAIPETGSSPETQECYIRLPGAQ